MARISYVDPGTVTDPELAGYLADAREHGTPRLESQAIRAHVPAVLRTFSQSWQQVFRDGVLDHRVKELARVFIAKSLECGYCAAQRSGLGAAQGLTERALDEVIDFRQSQLLTARDKAALRWAEAIAWDPGLADDDLWAELHRHFTEPELVELGYFIGLTMGQQRFLKTLGVRHGDLGRDSLAGLAPDAAAELAGSLPSTRAPPGDRRAAPSESVIPTGTHPAPASQPPRSSPASSTRPRDWSPSDLTPLPRAS